jgi:hypothetical protein
MFKNISLVSNLRRGVYKAGFKVKKHSPEILIVTGIVTGITGAVMACKATTKIDEVLTKPKDKLDQINTHIEENGYSEEYTEKDAKNDIAKVQLQAGYQLAKLYAPSVALGIVSVTSILSGYNIMHKRNVAISAAYAAVNNSFKEYRGRVVNRFGEALDKELFYDIKVKEEDKVVVNEDGSESVTKETVNVVDPNKIDATARIWYEGNPGWTKDPVYNLKYLKLQQAQASKRLELQGYLFLNDVYEMLGFPKTADGQVLGWIYDKEHPVGDNFVDFGIYDIHNNQKIKFVNGDERSILLEFNHDGNILDMM